VGDRSDFDVIFEALDAWQQHAQEQRDHWRELTPAQRLAWLWQAKLFAKRALEAATIRAGSPK
jgi:hypothetical protein